MWGYFATLGGQGLLVRIRNWQCNKAPDGQRQIRALFRTSIRWENKREESRIRKQKKILRLWRSVRNFVLLKSEDDLLPNSDELQASFLCRRIVPRWLVSLQSLIELGQSSVVHHNGLKQRTSLIKVWKYKNSSTNIGEHHDGYTQ